MTQRGRTTTVVGNWAHAVLRALDARGLDGAGVARKAGVSAEAIRNSDIRVPQPAMTRLWELAVEETNDSSFGLKVPRFVTPTTFGAFTFSLLSSRDLRAIFKRIARYHAVVTSAAIPRYQEDKEHVRFLIDFAPDRRPADASIDAFAYLIVATARFVSGGREVPPTRVRLRRPCPDTAEAHRKAFRCEVEFEAPENLLEFSRADAERALPDGNSTLALQHDQIMAGQLEALGQETLTSRVQNEILCTLAEGPTEALVARHLGVSRRNLSRLLQAEGTSYRTLLNETRSELARAYLTDRRYAVKEIAYLLGFADAATFSRAFKRWTGTTPKRYSAG